MIAGRRSLLCLLIPVLAAGCAAERVVTRTVVEPCPPAPPEVSCPAFPQRGKTLRSLLLAWEDARLAHAACSAAVDAWSQARTACDQASNAARMP